MTTFRHHIHNGAIKDTRKISWSKVEALDKHFTLLTSRKWERGYRSRKQLERPAGRIDLCSSCAREEKNDALSSVVVHVFCYFSGFVLEREREREREGERERERERERAKAGLSIVSLHNTYYSERFSEATHATQGQQWSPSHCSCPQTNCALCSPHNCFFLSLGKCPQSSRMHIFHLA